MHYSVKTLRDKPDYLEKVRKLNRSSWPEFLLYGDTPSWERLYDALSDSVLLLIEPDGFLAGTGFTAAVWWSGNTDELPASIEAILVNGLQAKEQSANTLMAVAALVDKRSRGQKLSTMLLKEMKNLARHHGFTDLLVPVRPTWKARYPLQSLDSYVTWRTADGLYYDPWLRTHQRIGGEFIKCVDSTYKVEGSIKDWQTWTGMIFPESGSYIVEGALQPVTIDRDADRGVYHDPNVWIRHRVE